GERKGEERDAPRAQREHRLARDYRLWPQERIPGGEAGAGEGGRLLPREVRGDFHSPLLVEEGTLREHAVEGAAELVDDVPLHLTVAPAREVATGRPVAYLEPRDRVARGHHLAGAIAQGDHAAPSRQALHQRASCA